MLEIDILFLLQVSAFALRVSGTRVFMDGSRWQSLRLPRLRLLSLYLQQVFQHPRQAGDE